MSEIVNKQKLKAVRKYYCKLKQESFGSLSGEETRNLALETFFNEDGVTIKEIRYNKDGEEEEIHEYTHDHNKKVITHHWLMPLEEVEEAEKMERDSNGKLLREVKMYGSDEGESVTYTYDEKGNVASAEFRDEEGEITSREDYIYNDHQTLSKRTIIDYAEKKNKTFEFIYNDKKNLAEQIEYDADGKLFRKTIYEQNEDGNDISIIQYNEKGAITQSVRSEYDENGRLVKKVSRGFFTRIVDYDYDERGNIIDETTTDENGAIISRNSFEFDEDNHLVFETYYEIDLTHSGRDTNLANRFEYDFY